MAPKVFTLMRKRITKLTNGEVQVMNWISLLLIYYPDSDDSGGKSNEVVRTFVATTVSEMLRYLHKIIH